MGQGQTTFSFPGTIPGPMTIQDSNLNSRIGGFTVINQSNCVCGLYIGRGASGFPDVQVAANQMIAFPINNTNLITVTWAAPGGLIPQGTAYAHYTDKNIIATASALVASSNSATTLVWDVGAWDANTWGN